MACLVSRHSMPHRRSLSAPAPPPFPSQQPHRRSHCVTGRSHYAPPADHTALPAAIPIPLRTALPAAIPIPLRTALPADHKATCAIIRVLKGSQSVLPTASVAKRRPCAIIRVLKGSQSVLPTASVAKRRPYAIIRVLKGSPSVPHSIGSATLSVLQSQALPALSGMKNPAGGMPPAGCFARGRDHIRHAAIRTGIKPRGQDQAISISVTGLTKSCLSRRKSSSITASTSVPALSLYNTTSFAASSVR